MNFYISELSENARAASKVWKSRKPQSTGNLAYYIYLTALALLVVAVPLLRAVWIGISSPRTVAFLIELNVPSVLVLLTSMLWSVSLLTGSKRGPALLPPFLTYALGSSPVSRWSVYSRRIYGAGLAVSVAIGAGTALPVMSLVGEKFIAPERGLLLIVGGVAVGIITSVMSLLGETFPSRARQLALIVLGAGVASLAAPSTWAFLPFGWWGIAYPENGDTTQALCSVVALVLLALVFLSSSRSAANHISYNTLMEQAARWNLATVFVSTMDFSAATEIYRQFPYFGRRFHAIIDSARPFLVFYVRDAIGSLRTPGRLISGIVGLAVSGVMLSLAPELAPTPGRVIGICAALISYFSLGSLTDGVRHAAQIASDLPLYGLSDAFIAIYHLIFPATTAIIVSGLSTVAYSTVEGTSISAGVSIAIYVSLLSLAARLAVALKGSMPASLLGPVQTPAGDMNALFRFIWALDGPLLATLIGLSAMLLTSAELLLVIITLSLLAFLIASRWRHRR